jgi:hypothetical protein
MKAAWNRKQDELIANAWFGDAITGAKGITTTTYASETGGIVAVDAGASASTGLNVEKLIQARQFLLAGEVEVDMEDVYIAITSKQLGDLLRSTEVTSSDYAAIKALVNGEVNEFMGFKFKNYERWNRNANSGTTSARKIPVWVKSGIVSGHWNNLESRIGERPDKEYLNQAFMRGTQGASRTQGAKVVQILCDET